MRKVAVAVIVAALAGCGGSSNGDSEALSAAQWRREANAICRDVGESVRRVDRPPPEHQGAEFVAAVAPLWDEQADAIAALVPPRELAQDAESYLGALDFLLRSLVETQTTARRGDESGRVGAALKTADAAVEAKTKAAALGLADCARQRIP